MDTIRIIFILPEGCADETDVSEIMLQAFEACKQTVGNVSWVRESCYEKIDLLKTDFLIFQTFEGKNFEKLKNYKCAIIGPWCVSVCLMEGRPIPNYPWPIYNVAMDGCTVSVSHLPKKTKLDLKEKIQLMGGCYTETLMSTNTHLVTDHVGTEKYVLAAQRGLKIMTAEWVDAVWNASQNANVKSSDAEFQKYECSMFHKLRFSATSVSVEERTKLSKVIVENGGSFTGQLNIQNTDFLIVGAGGTTSLKYKAARNAPHIQCVTPAWVYDSLEKGYALPANQYPVKKSTSTPTKEDTLNPDFSVMSAIAGPSNVNRTTLEETVNLSTMSNAHFSTPTKSNKRKGSFNNTLGSVVNGLDIKKAKLAGPFLDGCNVYIAGFDNEQREKVCRILNLSGATRYNDISDRVTHVIVGDPYCHELKVIRSRGYTCYFVSVKWLIESMENQHVAKEDNFLINMDPDKAGFGSPLSKKGVSLLRSNKTLTENDVSANESLAPQIEEDPTNAIVQQYLNPTSQGEDEDTLAQLLKGANGFDSRRTNTKPDINVDNPPGSTSTKTDIHVSIPVDRNESTTQNTETGYTDNEESSQPLDIFRGSTFTISGFDEDNTLSLREMIEIAAGDVLPSSYRGTPKYAVVPVFNVSEVTIKASEIINNLYITECLQEGAVLDLSYYHRPFVLTSTSPLEGSVITISGYSSFERSFLNNLIRELGGEAQDQFSRVTATQKNIKACTHLVSLEASGKKYSAALKWCLPVVNKDWLIDCAKYGRMVPEENYLVGSAKARERKENSPPNKGSISGLQAPSTSISTPPLSTVTCTSISENKGSETKRNSTPYRVCEPLKPNALFTPPAPVGKLKGGEKTGSPDVCSQVTPVSKIMEEVRNSNLLGTPKTPPMPRPWCDVVTPETPLGAFIRANPSPNLRKEMLRYINQFPDFVPPKDRRLSTPLSEVKRKLWNKVMTNFCGEGSSQDQQLGPGDLDEQDDDDNTQRSAIPHSDSTDGENGDVNRLNDSTKETPDKILMQSKFQKLQDMLTSSTEKRRCSRNFQTTMPAQVVNPEMKESQAFTVGWDYMNNEEEQAGQCSEKRMFMISGVDSDTRQHLVSQIESLGGVASELANYDPVCTHLICPKPARNEKTLACMAAGRWILHTSYIHQSKEAGHFLPEEEFEFGNEKSVKNLTINCDKDTEARMSSTCWWRKEISRRGYGAFNDMRAIVVANKRDPIIRVIEAGGGKVIDVSPPFDDPVHATHCLLEPRSVSDFSEYFPLAKQGIYCMNTLYISEFLHRTNKDIRDCVLPYFTKFYH